MVLRSYAPRCFPMNHENKPTVHRKRPTEEIKDFVSRFKGRIEGFKIAGNYTEYL